MKSFLWSIFFFAFFLNGSSSYGQLTASTNITPFSLVNNVLFGGNVTVNTVTYTGNAEARGQFQTGSVPTNLNLSSGIILSSGAVNNSIGSSSSNFMSTDMSSPGYDLLTNIAGYTTYDAAVLSFTFIPNSDFLEFKYVFASEEYNEFVASSFNDVFGFFITGPNPNGPDYNNKNLALIPNTSTPISINNVNNGNSSDCSYGPCTNCQYFVDNCNGTTIAYDAFTTVLAAQAHVIPGQEYTIIMAVADAMDGVYDSAVFLKAQSFKSLPYTVQVSGTSGVNSNFIIEGNPDATVKVKFTIPYILSYPFTINLGVGGTAVNCVDYVVLPDSGCFPGVVSIPPGDTTVTLEIFAYDDGIENGNKTIELSYSNVFPATNILSIPIRDNAITEVSQNESSNLLVFPNPVEQDVKIDLGRKYGQVNLRLFDCMGRFISESTFSGSSEICYPVEHLHSGMYYCVLSCDETSHVVRFVKK